MTNEEELRLYHRVFKSEDGQAVLAILKQRFKDKALYNNDTNAVYYALGKADLIQEIEIILKHDFTVSKKLNENFNPLK